MFSKSNSVVALCICLALVQSCSYHTESVLDLTLAHEVSPQPPRVGEVTITLRVTEASGKPITGARIKLEGNMAHPGMAPVFADTIEIEPGGYRGTMELSMAGDWFVLVHVILADGRQLDRQFEIKGVAQA